MSETNFQPIFDYIDESEKRIKSEIKSEMATKADIERVLKAVGAISKTSSEHEDKLLEAQNKTEQLEHWVIQAAERTEVPYRP